MTLDNRKLAPVKCECDLAHRSPSLDLRVLWFRVKLLTFGRFNFFLITFSISDNSIEAFAEHSWGGEDTHTQIAVIIVNQ
jgi:hypothetical protein